MGAIALQREPGGVDRSGGDLEIEWRESDGSVAMTGPVEFEFETRLDPNLFKDIAA